MIIPVWNNVDLPSLWFQDCERIASDCLLPVTGNQSAKQASTGSSNFKPLAWASCPHRLKGFSAAHYNMDR